MAILEPHPMTEPPYRVLLADDHAVFREGLKALLHEEPDFIVVAEVADGTHVAKAVERTKPDLVVLDVQLPGLSGPEVACQLRSLGHTACIVGLSAFADAAYVERFARCGATGYIMKTRPPSVIVESLREAARGNQVWLVRQPVASPLAELTEKERGMLVELANGYSNDEIAARLHLSSSTVRNTLTSIYEKIGVPSARAAVAWAWRHKLVDNSD